MQAGTGSQAIGSPVVVESAEVELEDSAPSSVVSSAPELVDVAAPVPASLIPVGSGEVLEEGDVLVLPSSFEPSARPSASEQPAIRRETQRPRA